MRQKINRQMSIFDLMHTSAIAKELRCISQILDQTPKILGLVSRICGDIQVPATCQVHDIRRFAGISGF